MKQFKIRPSRLARTALVLLIFAAQLSQFSFVRPVMAQGFALVVTSVGDEPDANVGDGRCDTDANAANGDRAPCARRFGRRIRLPPTSSTSI
jgi:hypothetical protein